MVIVAVEVFLLILLSVAEAVIVWVPAVILLTATLY